MAFIRIYSGTDGESHIEDFAFGTAGTPFETGRSSPIRAVRFRRSPAGEQMDWHPAPRRQMVATIGGEGEVLIAGGGRRRLLPGSVMLAEDLTGRGHVTNTLGEHDRISLAAVFDDTEPAIVPGPLAPSGIRHVAISAGGDGKAHFRDVELEALAGPGGAALPPWIPAKSFHFSSYNPSAASAMSGWHPAPRRQFLVTLSGRIAITASDGETRRFGPGDVLLVEDTEGEGHRNEILDGSWRTLVIVLG